MLLVATCPGVDVHAHALQKLELLTAGDQLGHKGGVEGTARHQRSRCQSQTATRVSQLPNQLLGTAHHCTATGRSYPVQAQDFVSGLNSRGC